MGRCFECRARCTAVCRTPPTAWSSIFRSCIRFCTNTCPTERESVQSMSRTTRGWAGLLIVALLVVAGCSRSPEAQKARYLERGDKFAAREQYQEAIPEYRNVLRLAPANARAIRQLGLAHYSLGEGPQAFRYLLKAQQLTPDDQEVRLKLGWIYLRVGKREEARQEAG